MSTFSVFAQQLRGFNKTVEDAANAKLRKIIMTLVNELVERTPIDTSRARTNWQTTIGSPATQEVAFVEGSRGSTAGEARSIAMGTASRVAMSATIRRPVYVTNCVPYIHDLNRGTSRQAPPNFVEHSVDVARILGAK